jgi:hypothetical protein
MNIGTVKPLNQLETNDVKTLYTSCLEEVADGNPPRDILRGKTHLSLPTFRDCVTRERETDRDRERERER